ncbi:MAG: zinc ABC transporter substrate-binding protein, partial [Elusimicrobiaceae bacterium]|nr:zinc ABC transporter substrate-binding protein [Elusimicrobiaceae bacterium]
MLLPPGAEPHAFEPTPGSMVLVHRADAFVYISDWLEPWVKDILGAAGKKT